MKIRSVVGSVCLVLAVLLIAPIALTPTRLIAQSGDGSSIARDDEDRGFGDDRDSRVRIGFSIAPVRLRYKARDRELVGLGSYLVNAAGGCNDCHTNPPYQPGRDPFRGEPEKINKAGYLAGGTAFGPFVSRNLTPDENGLPARLTLEQFLRVMRTGVDVKQRHPEISPLLQVMPWPVYRNLQTSDLRAIYAFLKAIPSAGRGAP
ncbi:MAG: cytochrome C [Luteitalea sp.]|nr:cytochrome C [Luteitalea sp.]